MRPRHASNFSASRQRRGEASASRTTLLSISHRMQCEFPWRISLVHFRAGHDNPMGYETETAILQDRQQIQLEAPTRGRTDFFQHF